MIFFLTFVYEVARGGLDWGPLHKYRSLERDAAMVSPARDSSSTIRRVGLEGRPPVSDDGRGAHRSRMGIVDDVRNDGFGGLSHNVITGRLEDLVNWARARSSWPASFGLACCAIEMMATGAAHYDISRFGMEVFRGSPRQADIMIVAGRVSQKMAPVLRQVYDQMMEPKWVISMGVCASSGGMFNNYAIVQGVDQVVPGRRVRAGLPADARDADPRHRDVAPEDRRRRDAEAPGGHWRWRQPARGGDRRHVGARPAREQVT